MGVVSSILATQDRRSSSTDFSSRGRWGARSHPRHCSHNGLGGGWDEYRGLADTCIKSGVAEVVTRFEANLAEASTVLPFLPRILRSKDREITRPQQVTVGRQQGLFDPCCHATGGHDVRSFVRAPPGTDPSPSLRLVYRQSAVPPPVPFTVRLRIRHRWSMLEEDPEDCLACADADARRRRRMRSDALEIEEGSPRLPCPMACSQTASIFRLPRGAFLQDGYEIPRAHVSSMATRCGKIGVSCRPSYR